MSDVEVINNNRNHRSDKNVSRKVEVDLDINNRNERSDQQIINHSEIIKVEIMKVLSKISEENEDIEIDDINRYVTENNVKVLINLKD